MFRTRKRIWKSRFFIPTANRSGLTKFPFGARRTKHIRFNDLTGPELIPRGTDYASVIESDVPVVVQHTRLDSRQAANALMTTMAFADIETVV